MDGDLLIQGHQARIKENDYNEVTIDNGTPGQKRNDLIVARYLKNTETGIESITLEVVKGTPGAAAIDPEIIQEDLKVGGTQRDYPLYRVALDGISLTNLTTLFNVVPTIASHLAEYATLGESVLLWDGYANSGDVFVAENFLNFMAIEITTNVNPQSAQGRGRTMIGVLPGGQTAARYPIISSVNQEWIRIEPNNNGDSVKVIEVSSATIYMTQIYGIGRKPNSGGL